MRVEDNNLPCLKAQKSATDRGMSVFFCISSSFEFHGFTPGALCYQNIKIFMLKSGCQAARPCLIIQQFSPIFVILCLHAFC